MLEDEPIPAVFLPGASGSSSVWRPVADRLEGVQHLVDYPGFADNGPDPAVRSLSDLHRSLLARLPPFFDLVAQSMGGVLALWAAIEHPERVRKLVLVATSGGVDVGRLGGVDWRPAWAARNQAAPPWFVDDRTDVTDRLHLVKASPLLVFGDADPISPVRVGEFLRDRIAGARLEVIQGGTHGMTTEVPDTVADRIRAYLRE